MNRVPDIGLIKSSREKVWIPFEERSTWIATTLLPERNGVNPVILTEPLANEENLPQSIPKELVQTETPSFKHWSGVT